MDLTEQFQQHVVSHMKNLSSVERQGWVDQSERGECVSISYEVYRGHLGRNTNEAFAAVATSHNAICPEDYFTPWLSGPHEIIGAVGQDDGTSPVPVYFFPHNGVYAMAINQTTVVDMWLSWPCYPVGW